MKAKTFYLILTILITGHCLQAQGWELNINVLPIQDHGNQILVADNGDYLISGWSYNGFEDDPVTFLSRITPEGVEVFTQTYTNTDLDSLDLQTAGMVAATNGDYFLAGTTFDENPHNLMILKVNETGDTLWTKKHVLPFTAEGGQYAMRSISKTSDGGYALIGAAESSSSSLLVKLNDEANVEWMEVIAPGLLDNRAHGVFEASDGNLVIAGRLRNDFASGARTFIQKRSIDGQELWTNDFAVTGSSFYHKTAVQEVAGGGFVIAEGSVIYKTDDNGVLQWEQTYPFVRFFGLDQTQDGGFVLTGEFQSTQDVFLMKTDANGELLWYRLFGGPAYDVGLDVIEDTDGSIVVTGSNRFDWTSTDGGDLYVIKTNSNGNLFDNLVKGRMYIDEDLNCEDDSGEPGINMNLVQITGSDTLYAFTDENGDYEISLDTGVYNIQPFLPNPYWGTCIDVPYPFEITDVPDTSTIDLPSQVLIECPYLEVDLSSPFLRRCFNSTYHINYCNSGTIEAEDAVITIVLDPFLDYVSSSIDLTAQNGDTLEFEIGNIPVDECGTFYMTVFVDCDSTVLGQTHCVTASITPDSICLPLDSLWSGATLIANAECTGDSIFLYIENIGTGNMTMPRGYIVTEDVIMYNSGEVELLSGESMLVEAIESNGATWRLEVEQELGHPGNSNPSIVVEGCVPTGEPFSLFFTNAFPQDDGNPFVSIECRENIGSYDPNDKQGFPSGWTDENFIERNEAIEYLIRFQNTGTDTAFTVVIEDPISEHMDVASIRPGASSHPYRLDFKNPNVLTFTFDHIMLPDSNINEAASHGFVKFKIDQKKDLPLGTIIYNQADIFFDFNEPIRTNETFHKVAEQLIFVDIEEPVLEHVMINAYPNPFVESTTIKITGNDFTDLELYLFDINGKAISSIKREDQSFVIQNKGLVPGMYFYRIEGDGQLLGLGKLIVQ